ncbi:MAG TPA: RNA methyltransferase [Opitutaceae bacterium]|nr:RNA methyltransferase [Opitutaceae bacterium]
MKPADLKICGLAAVRARFAHDAGSIQRLYFDYATGRKIGVMCRALAAARKVYRCVESAELEKIAGSVHHGGIVAVVSAAPLPSPAPADVARWTAHRSPLLVLDRVGNAHNLGAIARTAAFFGVAAIVLPADPAAAVPGDAAYRVAEGGLEAIGVFRVPELPAFLRNLASAGYEVIGAATRSGRVPARSASGVRPPVALVLGNEEQGLSPAVAKACTHLVTIPGRGKVESLNVSVAAAVLMWEFVGRGPH